MTEVGDDVGGVVEAATSMEGATDGTADGVIGDASVSFWERPNSEASSRSSNPVALAEVEFETYSVAEALPPMGVSIGGFGFWQRRENGTRPDASHANAHDVRTAIEGRGGRGWRRVASTKSGE